MKEPFKDHFSGVSSSYSLFRPQYPSALFSFLASNSLKHKLAWDCATGNGQAAIRLAEHFEGVVASDASMNQVAHAYKHPKIQYYVSTAERSGLMDESVDLITVAQALHWFPLDAFYKEVLRVLRPGGVLAVWCYGRMMFEQPSIDAAFQRFYSETVGPFWPPERQLVEDEYRTIPFPFAALPAPSLSIDISFDLEMLDGYLHTWSATQHFIKTNGYDPVPQLIDELRPIWGEMPKRTVRWPLAIRAGRYSPT